MKLHILKIKDRDDVWSDSMYYTIKGLRETIINVWYDTWDENREEPQDYTKEQIETSDEDMFSWLNGWGYDVEVILTITENDIPKRTDVIQVDVSFYHPNDNESIKVYDEEGMLEEFQYKLDCIIKNSGL
jgi:hypothetical protein